MSYMNRQGRRALRKLLAKGAWLVSIEYADGDTDLTAFRSEADARAAFQAALNVMAGEPDGILRVALLDPEEREVAAS